MSAREVCAALNIHPATLYSYVSRGLIRSEAMASRKRERRYLAEDVARLMARNQARHDPQAAAERAARGSLRWGEPVLESALTLITADGLYYRGQNALELAQNQPFEAVAALLWDAPPPDDSARIFARARTPVRSIAPPSESGAQPLISRMIEAMTRIEPPAAPISRVETAAQLVWTLAGAVCESPPEPVEIRPDPPHAAQAPPGQIAAFLAQQWRTQQAARLINVGLIVCADHELNASAFAVRVAASTDSELTYALIAGLAAFSGTKHGGASGMSAALLGHVLRYGRPRETVTSLLNTGQRIPGFGHRLYPRGDPRGALLLGLTRAVYAGSDAMIAADALIAAVADLTGLPPNIDLGLAALEWTAGLPAGSSAAIFALGRSAGWIAHALEQYRLDTLIRPRARYVGPTP